MFSQEPDVSPTPSDDPVVSSASEPFYHLLVGVSLQNYRYVEPGLISHNGILLGAWLNWDYKLIPQYSGKILADLATGNIDYDGALCDVDTNKCVDYKAKTNELIFKISHRFNFEVYQKINLFLGYGYRYIYDKGEGTGFYRRIGQYWLLPVGVSASIPWAEMQTSFMMDFEYDFFVSGAIESFLSDVNHAYSDIKHEQNQGNALRITFGFEPDVTEKNPLPWKVYLFYEKWLIGESDRVQLFISGQPSPNFFREPENRSEAIGVKIGWSY